MSELTDAGDETEAATTEEQPQNQQQGGNGRFAQELHNVTIHAQQRTFYVDLKESNHGKFFKITEKSRGGKKSTIMFDVEDLDQFIDALQEMKTQVS